MHHTPGRLRFKAPRLAENPQLAARCIAYAGGLHGVRDASLKTTTGSFLVHYCPRAIDPAALVALLNAHGGFGRLERRLVGDSGKNPLNNTLNNKLGEALLESVIAKSTELCVQALVKRLF